mmetsp:Transcript_16129/g.48788  ORF Transcript_16129/g.48788 Transcript_16129/m.48788 type:complete len:207 (-) Transcript_16129:46-666(-)
MTSWSDTRANMGSRMARATVCCTRPGTTPATSGTGLKGSKAPPNGTWTRIAKLRSKPPRRKSSAKSERGFENAGRGRTYPVLRIQRLASFPNSARNNWSTEHLTPGRLAPIEISLTSSTVLSEPRATSTTASTTATTPLPKRRRRRRRRLRHREQPSATAAASSSTTTRTTVPRRRRTRRRSDAGASSSRTTTTTGIDSNGHRRLL